MAYSTHPPRNARHRDRTVTALRRRMTELEESVAERLAADARRLERRVDTIMDTTSRIIAGVEPPSAPLGTAETLARAEVEEIIRHRVQVEQFGPCRPRLRLVWDATGDTAPR